MRVETTCDRLKKQQVTYIEKVDIAFKKLTLKREWNNKWPKATKPENWPTELNLPFWEKRVSRGRP